VSRRARRGPDPVFDGPPGPVAVRIVFERFPVTIKGAFVLRGGDANPHTARLVQAAVVRTPKGEAKPIPVESLPMDVAPRIDLFLPFEAALAELEPGWYVVRCALQVDGGSPEDIDSRPFSVAWPRGTTATGSATPGDRIAFGARAIVVDRVDLRGDRVEVIWRPEEWTGADPIISVSADGTTLDPVPPRAVANEPGAGRRRSVWYPAPRGTRSVTIQVSVGSTSRRVVVPIG
jgi:hypothetical protein